MAVGLLCLGELAGSQIVGSLRDCKGLAFKSYVHVAAGAEAATWARAKPLYAGKCGLRLIYPSAHAPVAGNLAFINFSVGRFRELSSGPTRV
jgi:hypothetical protein